MFPIVEKKERSFAFSNSLCGLATRFAPRVFQTVCKNPGAENCRASADRRRALCYTLGTCSFNASFKQPTQAGEPGFGVPAIFRTPEAISPRAPAQAGPRCQRSLELMRSCFRQEHSGPPLRGVLNDRENGSKRFSLVPLLQDSP